MINTLVQGVLLGGYYALIASGLSFMFSVMRIINLAHGSLAVLAAYMLFALAQHGHRRQYDQQAREGRDVPVLRQCKQHVGGEHGEAAMRQIDDAHDREHEAQPRCDQRVVAAEQHTLDEGVDHAGTRCW